MKLQFVVVAIAVAAANADPETPQECKDIYDKAVADFTSTPESRCEALVAYSKCLGGFPRDATIEALEEPLFSQHSAFCQQFWDKMEAPQLRVVRDNMVMTVDDAKKIEFHRHRRETINVFTMNEQIQNLVAGVDDLKTTFAKSLEDVETKLSASIAALKTSQDDLTSQFETFKGKVNQDLLDQTSAMEKQASDLNATFVKQKEDLDKALDAQKTDLATKMAEQKTELTKDLNALKTSLTGVSNSLTTTKTDLEKQIADPTRHMWSGGSKGHSTGGGWADFVLDRVEYNTAKPYFEQNGNKFRALKTGLYTIRWNYMHYTHNTCYRQGRIYINGQRVVPDTHQYLYHWQEARLQVTWEIKAGQIFYMQAKTDCGNPYRWHAGSSWNDAYNRVQVIYEGALPEKGCTSNQGLC